MVELDEILYNAIKADADLMQAVGGRVVSTCFEVAPDEQDNTQLPCIIVTDDGLTNQPTDKDCDWEAEEDRIQASVEVDGRSPREVKALSRLVRRAVAEYVKALADDGDPVPQLESLQGNGIAWDWMKPCYHTMLTYNCIIECNYE